VRVDDGYYGWAERAPFDVIVVTAVGSRIPPPLLKQLKPGGRMVLPVGTRFTTQELVLVRKDASGAISTRQILPVRFVPLTGGHD
jgi:protein-L-isoaspartate(D-aspartate) O-methyltransferase